jgi:hypothetical protein
VNPAALGAVFTNSGGAFLSPGVGTIAAPFNSLATHPNGRATNIPQDFTVPSVGFNNFAIAQVPNGASQLKFTVNDDYFSDNFNIGLQVGAFTLEDVLKDAVQVHTSKPSLSGINTAITAEFKPGLGLTLQQAASLGGFTGFNWIQTVESWPTAVPLQANDPSQISAGPFNDPPPGGYKYVRDRQNGVDNDSYPYYYDQDFNSANLFSVKYYTTESTLSFYDKPQMPNLPVGEFATFTTGLVGILPDGSPSVPLFVFTWNSNYSPIDDSGGVTPMTQSYPGLGGETTGFGGVRVLSETYFPQATPIPGALPLFATGLGALGLIAYRRKQKLAARS